MGFSCICKDFNRIVKICYNFMDFRHLQPNASNCKQFVQNIRFHTFMPELCKMCVITSWMTKTHVFLVKMSISPLFMCFQSFSFSNKLPFSSGLVIDFKTPWRTIAAKIWEFQRLCWIGCNWAESCGFVRNLRVVLDRVDLKMLSHVRAFNLILKKIDLLPLQ